MIKKMKYRRYIIPLLVFAACVFFKYSSQFSAAQSEPSVAGDLTHGDYEVLEGCSLVENRRNDGDSFYVKHESGKTEFRLYFVDTPESAYKEYRNGENNGERLDQQAKYFSINRKKAIEIGKKAKQFTQRLLQKHPFTIVTKWEGVYGPERRYGFVIVKYAGKPVYLHEILVKEGLVRIHTKPTTLPSGRSGREQLKYLKKLEAKAEEKGLGAWAR